jgi:twitching motility protein PilI
MDCFIVELENSQLLGVPLNLVKEVVSLTFEEICPIPGVKPNLLGVINQRGKLLWLLDLTQLLNKVKSSAKPLNKLIVLVTQYQQKNFGLVVKNLKEIRAIESNQNSEIEINKFEETSYLKYQTNIENETPLRIIDIDAIYNYIHHSN